VLCGGSAQVVLALQPDMRGDPHLIVKCGRRGADSARVTMSALSSPIDAGLSRPIDRVHALPNWRGKNIDLLRRLLAGGYLIAAITAFAAVTIYSSDAQDVGFLILAGVNACLAVTLAVGRRLPDGVIKFFAFSGAILLTSAAVALARPLGPTPLYFVWPALNCGYFGNRRDARVASVVMSVSFAIALALTTNVQVPIITYISVVSFFLVVLLAVQYQARRTDALVLDLARAAATDGLTGLLDRRAFSQAFEREIERARTSGLALSMVFFDLDHFKQVNDGFGHAAGDEVLCAFARILEREHSVTDLLARMGGEEFAVVLFDADADAAKHFAARIAMALAQWSVEHPPMLTTSAGIAVLSEQTATPSQMLTAADQALYAAKAAGRNRVIVSGQTTARVLVAA
jgi:diguanylate cyclase (GGDEF)-like protein